MLGAPADARLQGQGLAPAEEILLGNGRRYHCIVDGAVTGPHAENPRLLFLDADHDIRLVLRGPLLRLEIHLLEIAESAERVVAPFQGPLAVQIALHHGKLPPDHLVPGLGVSGDQDPVEMDLIPLLDLIAHVDRLTFLLRRGLEEDIRIGEPLIIAHLNQIIDVLDHRFPAEVFLFRDAQILQKRVMRDLQGVSGDLDLADLELSAFRYGDLQIDPLLVMGDLRLADLGVDEAVIQVKSVQLSDVLLQLILLQNARIGEEMKNAPLRGLHDVAERFIAESPVTLKIDFLHVGLVVFHDVEKDQNLLVALFFQNGRNLRIVITLGMIKIPDFLDVRIDFFRIHDLTGFRRQHAMDVANIDRLVPFDAHL